MGIFGKSEPRRYCQKCGSALILQREPKSYFDEATGERVDSFAELIVCSNAGGEGGVPGSGVYATGHFRIYAAAIPRDEWPDGAG